MGPIHLLAALAALATATPLAPRAPAAPRLVSAKFSGNGCPASSSNAVSGSTSRLTLEMPSLSAELGGPDDPYSRTRNCNAMLSIAEGVPGFKLAVRRVEGGGAAFYGSGGVELVVHSSSYWQDSPDVVVSLFFSPLLFLPEEEPPGTKNEGKGRNTTREDEIQGIIWGE